MKLLNFCHYNRNMPIEYLMTFDFFSFHPLSLALLTSSYLFSIPILSLISTLLLMMQKNEEKSQWTKSRAAEEKLLCRDVQKNLLQCENVMQITVNIKWTQLLENDIKTLSIVSKVFFIRFMANEMCNELQVLIETQTFWYWTLFNEF